MKDRDGFFAKKIGWNEIADYQDPKYIYRGHRCATWPLETSVERACKRLYKSLDKMLEMEKILLREFRRRYHHYSTNVPEWHQNMRWLSLMQHHGAPTRLLDFTYSIYVASYFALEHAMVDCAVWKINKDWLNEEGKKLNIIPCEVDDDDENILDEGPMNCVSAVKQVGPYHLDERLAVQQGVFLYPCSASHTFRANLRAIGGLNDSSKVLKLIISKKERLEALKTLHTMNISRATLFPGLDGFAQSLKVYHPRL